MIDLLQTWKDGIPTGDMTVQIQALDLTLVRREFGEDVTSIRIQPEGEYLGYKTFFVDEFEVIVPIYPNDTFDNVYKRLVDHVYGWTKIITIQ